MTCVMISRDQSGDQSCDQSGDQHMIAYKLKVAAYDFGHLGWWCAQNATCIACS